MSKQCIVSKAIGVGFYADRASRCHRNHRRLDRDTAAEARSESAYCGMRASSINNLKQLVLAAHSYHDSLGFLPYNGFCVPYNNGFVTSMANANTSGTTIAATVKYSDFSVDSTAIAPGEPARISSRPCASGGIRISTTKTVQSIRFSSTACRLRMRSILVPIRLSMAWRLVLQSISQDQKPVAGPTRFCPILNKAVSMTGPMAARPWSLTSKSVP